LGVRRTEQQNAEGQSSQYSCDTAHVWFSTLANVLIVQRIEQRNTGTPIIRMKLSEIIQAARVLVPDETSQLSLSCLLAER
jgi:hypothetical protein